MLLDGVKEIGGNSMDTYFDVKWGKCTKCYECVKLCTKTYPHLLGRLYIDEDGYPDYSGDNPSCHLCDAVVEGIPYRVNPRGEKETPYACNKLCPNDAMNITRW